MSVLNPTNASAFIASVSEFAEITEKAWKTVQRRNIVRATDMNNVLHSRLKEELVERIQEIKSNMIARFVIQLPYDEMQSMLMSPATLAVMQTAGALMGKQYTSYEYKLGDKVTIRVICRGGKIMPTTLFPNNELTIFSEDFLDLVRPLYLITKAWTDVQLAFEAVCKLIQDTRELNFYVPWLRLVIPQELDLTNQFNAAFRVSNWLKLSRENHSTINMITKQVRYILNSEHTSKRTWMPSELVHMVRQGEELVTQYNIMRSVPLPDTFLKEDHVNIEIVINAKDHPTIKWASEASTHRTISEVERIRKIDEKNRERESKW